jgi:hypothetical protein
MKKHAISKKICQGLKQQLMNFSFIFLAYTPFGYILKKPYSFVTFHNYYYKKKKRACH